jgi:hypothetical protein
MRTAALVLALSCAPALAQAPAEKALATKKIPAAKQQAMKQNPQYGTLQKETAQQERRQKALSSTMKERRSEPAKNSIRNER